MACAADACAAAEEDQMASSAVDCHSSQRPQIRCWRSHREADTLAVVVAVAVVVPANKRRRRLLGTPWAENAFSRVAAVQSHTKLVRACTVHAPEQVKSSQAKRPFRASYVPRFLSPNPLSSYSTVRFLLRLRRTFQQSSTHIEVITSDSLKAPGPCPGRIPLALPLASPQMVRQSSCTGTVEYSRSELMARAPV